MAERNNLSVGQNPQPWFRQVIDNDDSGCSIWSVHEKGEDSALPETEVEWTGDLVDLEQSEHVIPKYIRGNMNFDEDLEKCARRLAN